MGTVSHDAIIVTSWGKYTQEVREKAVEIFGDAVSEIVPSGMNGFESFFIAPDGSKEWWPDSDRGDARRAEFITWARSLKEGEPYFDWIAIQYGELGYQVMGHGS